METRAFSTTVLGEEAERCTMQPKLLFEQPCSLEALHNLEISWYRGSAEVLIWYGP